jgi:hypothetical protein
MKPKALFDLGEYGLEKLVERFYADTYTLDQNACSSPKLVIWYGSDKELIIEQFWEKLYTIVKKKYNKSYGQSVDKFTTLCSAVIDNSLVIGHVNFTTDRLQVSLDNIKKFNGHSGLFYEAYIKSLSELKSIANRKLQTITCFGVDRREILNWIIANNIQGIDRIVPVGAALNMDTTWDGFEMISTLSRKIQC